MANTDYEISDELKRKAEPLPSWQSLHGNATQQICLDEQELQKYDIEKGAKWLIDCAKEGYSVQISTPPVDKRHYIPENVTVATIKPHKQEGGKPTLVMFRPDVYDLIRKYAENKNTEDQGISRYYGFLEELQKELGAENVITKRTERISNLTFEPALEYVQNAGHWVQYVKDMTSAAIGSLTGRVS